MFGRYAQVSPETAKYFCFLAHTGQRSVPLSGWQPVVLGFKLSKHKLRPRLVCFITRKVHTARVWLVSAPSLLTSLPSLWDTLRLLVQKFQRWVTVQD